MEVGAPSYLSYGWVFWLSNVDLNPAIDVLLKVFFFFLLILFFLLEVFLGFLKAYVKKFSYQSVTTDDWKSFLYSHFKDKVSFKFFLFFMLHVAL